ncbi:MAG: hypothetical protein ABSE07_02655 [Methanoregula sp.]|jgi:uncharacterized membrane protein HdeD (DUF308 family)
MDTRLSCLIRGIIGVIFGVLALLFPELLLATFYGLFLLLAGLAIVVFLFLAITSKGDESPFWFGLSAGLLVVVVLSFLVPMIVEIIFLLIIAGIAFYNGFTDITLALAHPKNKYILIPGMFIAGAILLAVLLRYVPALYDNLLIVILGTFAFVFGLVSILMGIYQKEIPEQNPMDAPWMTKDKTCEFHKPERKK